MNRLSKSLALTSLCIGMIAPSMALSAAAVEVPITRRAQETGYYCGPASVQSVLGGKNINVSQSTLAAQMGTTTAGTAVYKIAETLRNYGAGYYNYEYISSAFPNNYEKAIKAGYAVVLNVNTQNMYGYNGRALQHYIVGFGYEYLTSTYRELWYFDPYYSYLGISANIRRPFGEIHQAIEQGTGYYIWAASK